MRTEQSTPGWLDSAGWYSLVFGIGALACAFVPIIGDFISAPIAVLAMGIGLAGIRRHEIHRSPGAIPATIGTVLGMVALLVVGIMFVATR